MDEGARGQGTKFPIISDFFLGFKNLKKIASGGFQTHPKYLEMTHSNHQVIDCTYYI